MADIDLSSLQSDLAFIDAISGQSARLGNTPVFEQLVLKYENIKIKMYQEKKHKMPHFHIDYGSRNHTASYAIDTGERIEGTLKRMYDKKIKEWSLENREKLLQVWHALQDGRPEGQFIQAIGTMS